MNPARSSFDAFKYGVSQWASSPGIDAQGLGSLSGTPHTQKLVSAGLYEDVDQDTVGFIENILDFSPRRNNSVEVRVENQTLEVPIGRSDGIEEISPGVAVTPAIVKRKKLKCVRSIGKPVNLLLGDEVTVDQVMELSNTAAAGKEMGRLLSAKYIQAWVTKSWENTLSKHWQKGWILFKFECPKEVERVFRTAWSIDSNPLLLKKWNPTFDVSEERMDVVPIWVCFPRLPVQL